MRPEDDEKRQGPRAEKKGVSDSQGKATVREKQLGPVNSEARSANVRR